MYTLVETVLINGESVDVYKESFNTCKEARKRLARVYEETVINRDPDVDCIHSTECGEDEAYVCYVDGMEIDWDVIEGRQ